MKRLLSLSGLTKEAVIVVIIAVAWLQIDRLIRLLSELTK